MSEENQNKNEEEDCFSKEDLLKIFEKRERTEIALLRAQKALAESQSFDLDYKNFILELFIKHRMSFEDRFDEETGKIIRSNINK